MNTQTRTVHVRTKSKKKNKIKYKNQIRGLDSSNVNILFKFANKFISDSTNKHLGI